MNAMTITGLCRRFGDKTAVDHLSLEVREGEMLALLGVNGAGKTTTLRMVSGLLPPDEGDVQIFGHSIRKEEAAAKALLNISPQETAVAPNLTVEENLTLIARLYGVEKKEALERAQEQIASFGLEDKRTKRAKTLSGGQRRRLSIAMALITRPRVLLLDEPTLGLDVLARRELWEHIRRLHGQVAIVLTTHYLEEAEALADRIGVMANGKLKALGTARELMEQTDKHNFEEAFIALAAEGGNAECLH